LTRFVLDEALRLMPDVCILPDHRPVACGTDETILGAALRAGISFAHACGGEAACSTCRLFVVDGWRLCTEPTPGERVIAERLGFTDRFRLACQTRVTADVTIRRLVLDDEDVELADLRPAASSRRAAQHRRAHTTRATPPHSRPRPIGEELRVAVLFADLRGFTTFSQALLPYDVIHELQRHFQGVTRAVSRQTGIVTSYMGDGVMALFCPGDGPTESSRRSGGPIQLAHDTPIGHRRFVSPRVRQRLARARRHICDQGGIDRRRMPMMAAATPTARAPNEPRVIRDHRITRSAASPTAGNQ
jgi:ferredoxin